jgi:integrase
MRVGEARAATCQDVNLTEGVITVRNTKFNKSRLVPLHRTTCGALHAYARHRDRVFRQGKTPAFFVGDGGAALSHAVIWKTFVRLLRHIGLREPSAPSAPRVHDLRHTFAVKALTRIYREGKNVDRRIHALSTYLGHSGPECTYWYLTAVPELMQFALRRLEKRIGGQR